MNISDFKCPICKKQYKGKTVFLKTDSGTEVCSECGKRGKLIENILSDFNLWLTFKNIKKIDKETIDDFLFYVRINTKESKNKADFLYLIKAILERKHL